jgi:hypothetical protein
MNKSRNKGTAWETATVNALEERKIRATRIPLSGAIAKGDIELLDLPFLIESKNCHKMTLADWIEQLKKEVGYSTRVAGFVWHHRSGKAHPKDGYVTTTGEQFMDTLEYMNSLLKKIEKLEVQIVRLTPGE